MSIEESFKYWHGQDGMPAWLEARLNELPESEREKCFIISTRNFKEIAELIFPQANADSGMWGWTFWHKSHAFVCEESIWDSRPAFRAVIGSKFPYFRITYGPAFPVQWCKFAMEIRCYQNTYVLVNPEKGTATTEYQKGKLFFSGGRVYCEEVAMKRDNLEIQKEH